VTEFEEGHRIAWQTGLSGPLSKFVGGGTWRYELEPVAGGTRVRETWDVSTERMRPLLRLGPVPGQTRANAERTLERIARLTTSPGDAGLPD
jgi:hypothetical protein